MIPTAAPISVRPAPSRALSRLAVSAVSRAVCWSLAGLCGVWLGVAQAQPVSPLDHHAREWLTQNLNPQSLPGGGNLPLRPEVVVGSLDPRLQLAPCARIEPYLPTGTQLWGRSRIGLKCMEGPVAWNVFLPITVKAWGPGWVVRRTVAANTPLSASDVEFVAEVDWAEQRANVLPEPSQWEGMLAAHTLMPGQVIRDNHVRPPQAFGAGSQVRVVASGSGFQLSSMGQAMTNGYIGQVARVKLDNGKVVSGKVRTGGHVEIPI